MVFCRQDNLHLQSLLHDDIRSPNLQIWLINGEREQEVLIFLPKRSINHCVWCSSTFLILEVLSRGVSLVRVDGDDANLLPKAGLLVY